MAPRIVLRTSIIPPTSRWLGVHRGHTTLSLAEAPDTPNEVPSAPQQRAPLAVESRLQAVSEPLIHSGRSPIPLWLPTASPGIILRRDLEPEALHNNPSDPTYDGQSLVCVPVTAPVATNHRFARPPLGSSKGVMGAVNRALDEAARDMGPSPSKIQLDLCIANIASQFASYFPDRHKFVSYLEEGMKARCRTKEPSSSSTTKAQSGSTEQTAGKAGTRRFLTAEKSERVVSCIDDLPEKGQQFLNGYMKEARASLGENPSPDRRRRYSKILAYELQQQMGVPVELDWLLSEVNQRLASKMQESVASSVVGEERRQTFVTTRYNPVVLQPGQGLDIAGAKPRSENDVAITGNVSPEQNKRFKRACAKCVETMDPFLTNDQFKKYREDVMTKLQAKFDCESDVLSTVSDQLVRSREAKLNRLYNLDIKKCKRASTLRGAIQDFVQPYIKTEDLLENVTYAASAPLSVSTLDLTPEGLLPSGGLWKMPEPGDHGLPKDRIIKEHPAVALVNAIRSQKPNWKTAGYPEFWADAATPRTPKGSGKDIVGGIGVVFRAPGTNSERRWIRQAYAAAFDKGSSLFYEILAIAQALQIASTMERPVERDQRIVTIYTDSATALAYLSRPFDDDSSTAKVLAAQVAQAIKKFEILMDCRVELCWIPGHQYIPGHALADISAGRAARREEERRADRKIVRPGAPTDTKGSAGITQVDDLVSVRRSLSQLGDCIERVFSSKMQIESRVAQVDATSVTENLEIAAQLDTCDERSQGKEKGTTLSGMISRIQCLERDIVNSVPKMKRSCSVESQSVAAMIDSLVTEFDAENPVALGAEEVEQRLGLVESTTPGVTSHCGNIKPTILAVSDKVKQLTLATDGIFKPGDAKEQAVVKDSTKTSIECLSELADNRAEKIRRISSRLPALAIKIQDLATVAKKEGLSAANPKILKRIVRQQYHIKQCIKSCSKMASLLETANEELRNLSVTVHGRSVGAATEAVEAKLQSSVDGDEKFNEPPLHADEKVNKRLLGAERKPRDSATRDEKLDKRLLDAEHKLQRFDKKLHTRLVDTEHMLQIVTDMNRQLITRVDDMNTALEKRNPLEKEHLEDQSRFEQLLQEIVAKNEQLEERTSRLEAENRVLRERQRAIDNREADKGTKPDSVPDQVVPKQDHKSQTRQLEEDQPPKAPQQAVKEENISTSAASAQPAGTYADKMKNFLWGQ